MRYAKKKGQERENSGEETFCYSWGSYWCLSWQILYSYNIIFSFHLTHVWIIGSMEFGMTRNDSIQVNEGKQNNLRLKKYHADKFIETIGIEIQSQHWGGNKKLTMEVIAVE